MLNYRKITIIILFELLFSANLCWAGEIVKPPCIYNPKLAQSIDLEEFNIHDIIKIGKQKFLVIDMTAGHRLELQEIINNNIYNTATNISYSESFKFQINFQGNTPAPQGKS